MDNCNGKTVVCDYHFFKYLESIRYANRKLWNTVVMNMKQEMLFDYLMSSKDAANDVANVCMEFISSMMDEGEL